VCTAGCCSRYAVTITGYDVWTIARHYQLAPEQFLVTIPQKKTTGRGFHLPAHEGTFDIALDKAATGTEAEVCVFWLDFPGGIGRCGIYPHRPFACQVYPAFFDEGTPAKRDDVLCPDDAWLDGSLAKPIWRDRLLLLQVEYDIYGLAVARWNYHVQNTPTPHLIDIPGYYAYLMNFYGRLEPLRDRFDAAQWMALCTAWAACWMDGVSPLVARVPAMDRWADDLDSIVAVANGFFPSDPRSQAGGGEPRADRPVTEAGASPEDPSAPPTTR
jgi:Fe-S-cluster containining protein